ncbi:MULTISPECIES: hypothetical protein [unclassified Bradyrhizobium]|uniref:hypothetical protein n=1 Tax=Bradyrhizobium TaxID=374 RepID=UPI002915F046|nr:MULTISPECIES: hypothetical protein [unclassified Bradyrhizobium]
MALGVDGNADFNALRSRKHNHKVQLYAFDILALEDDDLRDLPRPIGKTSLARRPDGIFVAPFETGEIGPDLFRAAWNIGRGDTVSKRSDRPTAPSESKDWIKKNRTDSAMSRVTDTFY